MTFDQPMLACPLLEPTVEHTDNNVYEAMKSLRYPVLASLKLDGIRGLRLSGTLLSRKLKRIPNKEICEASTVLPGGFDMELWDPLRDYNEIQSIVMSHVHNDSIHVQFHILDCYFPHLPSMGYEQRIDEVQKILADIKNPRIVSPSIFKCASAKELFEFELKCIEEVGEGICFRTPSGPYKFGRSTLEEQYLIKLSRYIRDECRIVGFKEQMENGNPATYDRTGKMDRSHSISNLIGKDTLGAFLVENTKGQIFPIGTGVGLTNKMRKYVWENQEKYLNTVWTYKCKPHGQKILPRQPILVGQRNKIDL